MAFEGIEYGILVTKKVGELSILEAFFAWKSTVPMLFSLREKVKNEE